MFIFCFFTFFLFIFETFLMTVSLYENLDSFKMTIKLGLKKCFNSFYSLTIYQFYFKKTQNWPKKCYFWNILKEIKIILRIRKHTSNIPCLMGTEGLVEVPTNIFYYLSNQAISWLLDMHKNRLENHKSISSSWCNFSKDFFIIL